jgi:hypothetical protein
MADIIGSWTCWGKTSLIVLPIISWGGMKRRDGFVGAIRMYRPSLSYTMITSLMARKSARSSPSERVIDSWLIFNFSSAFFFSVMSWCTARKPNMLPVSSRIGLFEPATVSSRPSLLRFVISPETVPLLSNVPQKYSYCSFGIRPDLIIRGVLPRASGAV